MMIHARPPGKRNSRKTSRVGKHAPASRKAARAIVNMWGRKGNPGLARISSNYRG